MIFIERQNEIFGIFHAENVDSKYVKFMTKNNDIVSSYFFHIKFTNLHDDDGMQKDDIAIRVINACKSFQTDRPALSGVDLTIQRGECVGLLGASGSGKSTLLRSLCGLERLDAASSEVQLWGQTLQKGGKLSPSIRQLRTHIGIIFQQFNLVGRIDVLTNVMTGLLPQMPLYRSLLGQFSTEERFKALQALVSVGLSEQAIQRASTLSGGQQQRAAIARALVQGARILLADEPVASLDPESTRRVMDLLRQLQREQGMTLVISLHNVNLARKYCDRIIALREGRLVYDGAPMGLDNQTLRDLYGTRSDELFMDNASEETLPFLNPTPQLMGH
jgi:phosphonate transport system ATP-binding protein